VAFTTRPTRNNIDSLLNDWDADDEANFAKLFDQPTPLPEQTDTDDETDLLTNFPVAQFGNCLVWVMHSTLGWTLYAANANTDWRALSQNMRCPRTSFNGTSGTLAASDTMVLCTNASPQTVTLMTAASAAGRIVTVKQLGAGAVTVDGNGAETIDGAANYAIPAANGSVQLYSDGTSWYIVAKGT
jgi:hypothetical protein